MLGLDGGVGGAKDHAPGEYLDVGGFEVVDYQLAVIGSPFEFECACFDGRPRGGCAVPVECAGSVGSELPVEPSCDVARQLEHGRCGRKLCDLRAPTANTNPGLVAWIFTSSTLGWLRGYSLPQPWVGGVWVALGGARGFIPLHNVIVPDHVVSPWCCWSGAARADDAPGRDLAWGSDAFPCRR